MSTLITPPLDFDVLKETWGKYQLADHSLLKVKIVLTIVSKRQNQTAASTQEGSLSGYELENQAIIVVVTNERGPPDTKTYSPVEVSAAITKSDIRFDTIAQDWNEYVVDDGTRIMLQPMLMSVSKTSLFNNKGAPIYVTNIGVNVQVKPPRSQFPSPTS